MDAIRAQVIQGRLNQIAHEMSRRLIRMGFSIIIKESEDIGCALVDSEGWQLCEADTTPLQAGPTPWYVQGVLRLLEERNELVKPGDIFIHNDPYLGASHSPDIAFLVPIFHCGLLIAWSCTAAHHMDIGCAKPGTSVIDAVDEWAGGLRLRAVRIRDGGVDNQPLWNMIADNVRLPKLVLGDMAAQIAACELGALRLLSLIDEVGIDDVFGAKAWYEDYSERMLRNQILAIPDGEYAAVGYSDGIPDHPDPDRRRLKIAVTLRIKGAELEVDLTGTGKQLDNLPFNMPLQGTVMCSIFTVVRSVLLDTELFETVPQNRGLVRPITVIAPKGTLVNPTFPAPTLARVMPALVLTDTLVRAFAQVIPERCCAGTGAIAVFTYSGIRDGEVWVHMDIHEGSYGARWEKDGMDAMDTLMTNTRCAPIEEIETEYPIRCLRWELNDEPVGHGRFRGGKGGVREFQFLTSGYFSSEADGHLTAPWGFAGGSDGTPAEMWVDNPGVESVERLSSKQPGRPAERLAVFRCVAPNGGGIGSPLKRDPEKVLGDLLDEIVAFDEARDVYGVVVDMVSKSVNLGETEQLRLALESKLTDGSLTS